jgi:uncharacterized membrane protein YgdD (TMEM256/DUF423 family)
MSIRLLWIVAALLGLSGVAAGAFGAHGLRDSVTPRDLENWKTAATYQQVHALLLLIVVALRSQADAPALRVAGLAGVAGVLVFSGTLYAMVLGAPRWLGAITPVGGLALMLAWGSLAVGGLRGPSGPTPTDPVAAEARRTSASPSEPRD